MRYWLTTQWPHTKEVDNPHTPHTDVWLRAGHEDIARELSPGDLVFIYETKYGKPRADSLGYHEGWQGITDLIKVVEVNTRGFMQSEEEYKDGTSTLWKLVARGRLISSGFCPRENVCEVLGYSTNYFFLGYGRRGADGKPSGLGLLTDDQYQRLRSCLTRGTQSEP